MMNPCKTARFKALALGMMLLVSVTLFPRPVVAQGLRDPTLPPLEAGLGSNAATEPLNGPTPGPMTLIVRNGCPYLVLGTRLYAEGQKMGEARIERLSETEVWLREGGVLRKLPQFAGVERRTVAPVTPVPQGTQATPMSKKSSSTKTPAPAVPCTGASPRGLLQ